MTWHYLVVYIDHPNGDRTYGFCEIYLDEQGFVENWTENTVIAPGGESLADLVGDVEHMLEDAKRWKPMARSELVVGDVLKPALSSR